jgi:hypothetical protein
MFGSVYVLSELATADLSIASLPSAAVPSNCTPLDVLTVTTLFTVCVPVTVKLPGIVTTELEPLPRVISTSSSASPLVIVIPGCNSPS